MSLPLVTRLAFVAVLAAEVTGLVLVSRWLGGFATFWLVLGTAFAGFWVIRREGVRAWSALGEAVRVGRLPADGLADSSAAIVGGIMLVVPGFLTDIVGVLLAVRPTRPVARRALGRLLPPGPGQVDGRTARPGVPPHSGPVIPGEVVDADDATKLGEDDR